MCLRKIYCNIYIFHKSCNTYYGDLIPMIMANALSINVSILTYTGSAYNTRLVQPVFQQPCLTVTVYKTKDHYDVVVPIYSMNHVVPRRKGQLAHGNSMPVSNETTNVKTDGMGSISQMTSLNTVPLMVYSALLQSMPVLMIAILKIMSRKTSLGPLISGLTSHIDVYRTQK